MKVSARVPPTVGGTHAAAAAADSSLPTCIHFQFQPLVSADVSRRELSKKKSGRHEVEKMSSLSKNG